MSILFRAAVLGGIAYLITRSLSQQSSGRSFVAGGRPSPLNELHPGENGQNIWPTSESQEAQRTTAAAGPGA